jgi:hypothetical protein
MINKKSLKVVVAATAIPIIIVLTTIAQSENSIFSPIVFGPSYYLPGPNEIEPNNNFDEANGVLLPEIQYFGFPNDADDYYFFYIGEIGDIEVTVLGLNVPEAQVIIYRETEDNPPEVVETYDTPPDFNIKLTRRAAGKYYVVVHIGPAGMQLRQGGPYRLSVNYVLPPTPTPEPAKTETPTIGPSLTPTPKATSDGEGTPTPTIKSTPRLEIAPLETPLPGSSTYP